MKEHELYQTGQRDTTRTRAEPGSKGSCAVSHGGRSPAVSRSVMENKRWRKGHSVTVSVKQNTPSPLLQVQEKQAVSLRRLH